jgi:predicted RecA/RadA family phage recombinase
MSRESRDRKVWGEPMPLYIPVKAATDIKTGDLVECGDGVDLEPLASAVYISNFCGVAMQDSVQAVPSAIRVATEGVFEFDCAAAALAAGQPVKMGNHQQHVAATAAYGTIVDAIGRVWKTKAQGLTKVWVKIDTKLKWSTGVES